MTRTHRAAWTYITSLIQFLLSLLVGFVATPFLIELLGEERFGASRVLIEYSGYLVIIERGISGALAALLVKAVASEEENLIRQTLVAGFRSLALIAGAMIVIGLPATFLIVELVPVAPELKGDLATGWLATLFAVALFPFLPFRTLIETEQRGYLVSLLMILQTCLIPALAITFAYLGFGITGQMLAIVLGFAPVTLILFFIASRKHSGITKALFVDRENPDLRKQLWKLNGPTLTFTLIFRLSVLSDFIILSAIMGPVLVTMVFVTIRLSTIVQSQLQAINSATWAGLSQLQAKKEYEKFNRRLIELTGLIIIFGIGVLVPIIVYNKQFIKLWVGEDKYSGELVTLFGAANALLLSLFNLWNWRFTSTGRVAMILPPAYVSTGVNLIASLVLTWYLGAIGPLLGTFFGLGGIYLCWLAFLLKREFGTSLRSLAGAVFKPCVLGIPYIAALLYFAEYYPPASWSELILYSGLSVLCFLFVSWFMLIDYSQRQDWMFRVKMILGFNRA